MNWTKINEGALVVQCFSLCTSARALTWAPQTPYATFLVFSFYFLKPATKRHLLFKKKHKKRINFSLCFFFFFLASFCRKTTTTNKAHQKLRCHTKNALLASSLPFQQFSFLFVCLPVNFFSSLSSKLTGFVFPLASLFFVKLFAPTSCLSTCWLKSEEGKKEKDGGSCFKSMNKWFFVHWFDHWIFV